MTLLHTRQLRQVSLLGYLPGCRQTRLERFASDCRIASPQVLFWAITSIWPIG